MLEPMRLLQFMMILFKLYILVHKLIVNLLQLMMTSLELIDLVG